jgi:hypothetical protein
VEGSSLQISILKVGWFCTRALAENLKSAL